MKLEIAFGTVVGVLLTLAAPAAARAQFSAQPVILEVAAVDSAGVSRFSVRNESEDELRIVVFAGDFDQPVEGGHRFMEPGEHPRSCAGRLQFFPENLVLRGRESGEVSVRMAPGDSTCWSLLFVQSVSRNEDGIRIAHRIGIKVYGVSGRGLPEGEIVGAEVVEDAASGSRVLQLDFSNLSDLPVRPEGEVEIRSLAGEVLAVVGVEPFSVLPFHVRRTAVVLETELDPGSYLAIPILDFGGEYLAGGQAVFEVRRP